MFTAPPVYICFDQKIIDILNGEKLLFFYIYTNLHSVPTSKLTLPSVRPGNRSRFEAEQIHNAGVTIALHCVCECVRVCMCALEYSQVSATLWLV